MTVTAAAPPAVTAGAAATVGGAVWRARLEDSHRREAARTLATADAGARCPRCRGPVVIGATVRVAHGPGCNRRAAMVAAAPRLAARLVRSDDGPGQVSPAVHPDREAAQETAAAAQDSPASAAGEPAGAPGRPQHLDGRERHPHRHRRQHRPGQAGGCEWTSQPPAMAVDEQMRHRWEQEEQEIRRYGGIRPWVVLRWFVSGCRIVVQGFLATVRSVIRWKEDKRWEGEKLSVRLDFDDSSDWPDEVRKRVPEWWALDEIFASERAGCAAA